ncbi:MAG: hypothetical protein P4M01_06460 [Acidobacteriota bacterium]|nr:hypothetical protein [Acidobacteriota bacterium]
MRLIACTAKVLLCCFVGGYNSKKLKLSQPLEVRPVTAEAALLQAAGGTLILRMIMTMQKVAIAVVLIFLSGVGTLSGQANSKTYKHAPQYQVAVLDQNVRVETGVDATLAKTQTDSKLGGGGQGIHLLHTDAGDYRVEAPVNKGMTFLSAMGSNAYNPAKVYHNKWFLDNVHPGTKVLFASECAKPSRKHPNDAVRCTFWFPDPDSTTHEYMTIGDFTPFLGGDGSNTAKTANALCGTGKLNPATEAEICGQQSAPEPIKPPAPIPAPEPPPAAAAETGTKPVN